MRCKSMTLLREAMRLSQKRAEAAVATSSTGRILEHTALPAEWFTQYWETLEDVTSHVALLYPQMLQASLCADPQHALCLKVCIIIVLTAQVELHRMPGTYHSESRQKALNVILDVIGLTKGLKDEDYAMLEPILGVRATRRGIDRATNPTFQVCFTIVANAIRNDRELLFGMAEHSEGDPKESEAFNVLINSAQQLATKLPYVGKYSAYPSTKRPTEHRIAEYSLQTLCEIASTSNASTANKPS